MTKIKRSTPPFLIAGALLLTLLQSGGIFYEGCIAACALLGLCVLLRLNAVSRAECLLFPALTLVLLSLAFTQTGLENSFHETFKLILALSAFCAVRAAAHKDFLPLLLFSASVLTALAGLVAFGGIVSFPEFVLTDGSLFRLQSFFKYSNTAACFLGCGYYAAVSLIFSHTEKKYARPLTIGSSLILLALFLTVSKAVIPLFLLLGTLAYYKDDRRLTFFIRQNLFLLPLAAVLLLLRSTGHTIVLYLFALIGILGGGWMGERTQKRKLLWRIWLVCAGTAAVGVIALLICTPSLFTTALQRVHYSLDALPLVWKHPLLGHGAGSWRYLQYSVRSHAYDVGYLHNGPLELALENGQPLFLLLMGSCVWILLRAFRQKQTEYLPALALILIHSFFDIDLSFGCMMIVVGLYAGTLYAPVKNEAKRSFWRVVGGLSLLLVSLTSLAFSYWGGKEVMLTERFEKAYLSGNREQASEAVEALEKAFPYHAEPVYYKASVRQSMGAPEEELTALLAKAAALAPYDTQKQEAYMVYALNEANLDALCADYLDRAPLRKETYKYIRDILYYAAENGFLSAEACTQKQKEYHEIYRKSHGITTPMVGLKAGRYTEFVSLTELDGVYYLPLRRTLELFGWQVSYKAEEKLITADREMENLKLYSGQKTAYHNEEPLLLAYAVVNQEGVALIAAKDLERLTDVGALEYIE